MKIAKMTWELVRENVWAKHLSRDEKKNFQIDVIKLKPNTKYNEHQLPDIEWIYVLKGSFSDHRSSFKKGDFIINEKDSRHAAKTGETGCELLCCWCGKVV